MGKILEMTEAQKREIVASETAQAVALGDTLCSLCLKVIEETEAFVIGFAGEHDNGDPIVTVTCEACADKGYGSNGVHPLWDCFNNEVLLAVNWRDVEANSEYYEAMWKRWVVNHEAEKKAIEDKLSATDAAFADIMAGFDF